MKPGDYKEFKIGEKSRTTPMRFRCGPCNQTLLEVGSMPPGAPTNVSMKLYPGVVMVLVCPGCGTKYKLPDGE